MASINDLNSRYEQLNSYLDFNEKSCSQIDQIAREYGKAITACHKLETVVAGYSDALGFFPDGLMFDVVTLIKSSCIYLDKVEKYNQSALDRVYSRNSSNSRSFSSDITSAYSSLEKNKLLIQARYGITIDSPISLCKATKTAIGRFSDKVKNEISSVKQEALMEINKQESLVIGNNCLFSEKLPEKLTFARTLSKSKPSNLLKAIGRNELYDDIYTNLRANGNVYVETDFHHTTDAELDVFVLAYIFKFIESFPLGAVNVHIFDRNPNKYNQRLHNLFKEGNYSELAKKTVSLYDYQSLEQLNEITSVITSDIFRKTNLEYPDLYSLYDIDKTDAFNLFVLRDGLIDSNGYSANKVLQNLSMLTKPNEQGHMCGIRFLIIDDCISRQTTTNGNIGYLVDSISSNCDVHIRYDENKFSFDGKRIETLRFNGELDKIIQERATQLAENISKREKHVVAYSDLQVQRNNDFADGMLRIPIGKAGNSVVELPFGCKDDKGSVDAHCIGYMVIGQSGSGKSSFFHSLIFNACMRYSPDELNFWLLDFKFGSSTSLYLKSQLPHVRYVAEKNRIDDALCLFQMILDEMERRSKLMERESVLDIVDYNKKVDKDKRLSRIIVMIDEVQEIFKDDSSLELQRMLSSISSRMRASGMHLVMIAQNLSEGKSYMIKDAFMPSATGRICFAVAENIPHESGFEEPFVQRKTEIAGLLAGEAYVSWGKETIRKVKVAFSDSETLINEYFPAIKHKYSEYSYMKPLIIGTKKRLQISDAVQMGEGSYYDVLCSMKQEKINRTLVGEHSYTMLPISIDFSMVQNSSLLVLGDDKQISSSICAMVALGLIGRKAEVHLFNADKQKTIISDDTVVHPFMYVSNKLGGHKLDEFDSVIESIYCTYLERRSYVQKCDEDELPEFESIFLIVNDLFGIEKFELNNMISHREIPSNNESQTYNFSVFEDNSDNSNSMDFNERIQDILAKLVKTGYRYNIHVVLAIKGDPMSWRNIRPSDVNNVILFNPTQYVTQIDNQYFVREMLNNIAADTKDETMAVFVNHKRINKMRPILLDMSNDSDVNCVDRILGEVAL